METVMTGRLRLTALFIILIGGVLAAGQTTSSTAPPGASQTPNFRVAVEGVEVDAIVTDRDGQFVRGLTQNDFQIFEDGKPQPISTFSIVDIPVDKLQRPLFSAQAIEPDVMSNERPFDGRVYVMVVDDLHTYAGRTPRVRAAARQFIEQHLGANDLMAVVHTAGPDDASQEFTSNKKLLVAAVDRTIGRKLESATLSRTRQAQQETSSGLRRPDDPVADPEEAERRTNAQQSLNVLRDIADWFATVRGRRKAILFVSEGIDYDINDFA